jgi:hypothetical protein
LNISDNADLTTVDLSALTSVGEDLSISGNAALTNFSLPALSSVGRDLYVKDNAVLTSLYFPIMASVDGSLEISGNPNLPQCGVCALKDQLESLGGAFTSLNNKPDSCNDTCTPQ